MDNLNKNERSALYNNQQRSRISNNTNQDMPRHLQKTRDFDVSMYDRGKQWQQNGLPISSASDDLKRNVNFVKGWHRADQMSGIVGKKKDII